MKQLPPIITVEQAAGLDCVWCDVRWYPDGRSGYDAYLAGHVDGAIFVDLDQHLADPPTAEQGRHPLPSAEKFTQTLGELGIGAGDQVVAYDDGGGFSAGRMVWMLRVLGYQAALLDGGLQAWQAAMGADAGTGGAALSTTATTRASLQSSTDASATSAGKEVRSGEQEVRQWPEALLADADQVAALAGDQAGNATGNAAGSAAGNAAGNRAGNVVLADARAPERFRGEVEPLDARPGHIPGAVNLPWDGNLDSEGRFLSPAKLRQRFESFGILSPPADAPMTIMYCGSGVSACHNLLALEHAVLEQNEAAINVKLYPGSWSQWSAQPDRPAELGDPASLAS